MISYLFECTESHFLCVEAMKYVFIPLKLQSNCVPMPAVFSPKNNTCYFLQTQNLDFCVLKTSNTLTPVSD